MNTTHHPHNWSHLLGRFAQAVGESDYSFGPLSFSQPGGPTIVAELLDDGRALGLTVDLQHTPDDERLEDFLLANQAGRAQDVGVYAVYPARNNTLLFFRRLEDAGAYAYEDFMQAMRSFSGCAQAALDALPQPLQVEADTLPSDAAAFHEESFRHIWSDFALAQNLGGERPQPEVDGSHILSLDGGRFVFVRPDFARGSVVLSTMLALLPLFCDEPPAWLGLLEAHTLGLATGGGVFAIDPGERELIVWRSVPLAGLDAYGLNDAIDSLAEVARFYTEEFALDAVPA
ncbi:type III secretion system chaperone [Hydrogenophaga sp. BPS33]|uniref:type III secretion system chaperone n=1 Tax=Hydrogenophaga sp. BPS33 TaxID=2651974 RepID=UPI00131FD11D|nr:type III secretion system chaperone [Hydrogenophaga sp. BPS33]QHE83934.1 type III secretion system chaperone [Hydrogenophaga sp. BPS33]